MKWDGPPTKSKPSSGKTNFCRYVAATLWLFSLHTDTRLLLAGAAVKPRLSPPHSKTKTDPARQQYRAREHGLGGAALDDRHTAACLAGLRLLFRQAPLPPPLQPPLLGLAVLPPQRQGTRVLPGVGSPERGDRPAEGVVLVPEHGGLVVDHDTDRHRHRAFAFFSRFGRSRRCLRRWRWPRNTQTRAFTIVATCLHCRIGSIRDVLVALRSTEHRRYKAAVQPQLFGTLERSWVVRWWIGTIATTTPSGTKEEDKQGQNHLAACEKRCRKRRSCACPLHMRWGNIRQRVSSFGSKLVAVLQQQVAAVAAVGREREADRQERERGRTHLAVVFRDY